MNPACHSHSKRTTWWPTPGRRVHSAALSQKGGARRCKGKHSLSKRAWPRTQGQEGGCDGVMIGGLEAASNIEHGKLVSNVPKQAEESWGDGGGPLSFFQGSPGTKSSPLWLLAPSWYANSTPSVARKPACLHAATHSPSNLPGITLW